jgi:hypothetical protein
MERYFNSRQACKAIPCSDEELHRLILEEKIEAVESGPYIFIPVEEVSRYRATVESENQLN